MANRTKPATDRDKPRRALTLDFCGPNIGGMNQMASPLQQILIETSRCLVAGHDVLMVFDLDSTLFDVSPRIQRILQDFAEQASIQAMDPDGAKVVSEIKTDRKDWGIRAAVERAGLIDAKPQLAQLVRDFWVRHFFSNEYLQYDHPLEGAVAFVNFVHAIGAKIIYLTGRDALKMWTGSLAGLRKHGFPISENGIELVMKPGHGIDDAVFKESWFDQLARPNTCKIWFFENEPINLQKVRLRHPEVELIFVDTTHSQKIPSPTDLKTIDDFTLDWGRLAPSLSPTHAVLIPKTT